MKASIIIRAYNAEKTLARAVESALTQEFPQEEFEVIIINDGSTDRTGHILERYKHDTRIRIIAQENAGATKAANAGFRAAHGRFVALLDCDDEYRPNFLSETTERLDMDPSVDFVYTDYFEEYQGTVRTVTLGNLFETIADNTVYRKKSLEKEDFYRAEVLFPEYDILLRTYGKWNGEHLKRPLVTYHRNRTSLTGTKGWVENALAQLGALHPRRTSEISKIRSYVLS